MNTNHNLPDTLQALKERYPYMFAGQNIGFAFYRGWFEMFVQLCADIDAALGENRRGFHWVQIKEKFGSYRLYYSMQQDAGVTSISYEAVPGPGHVGLRPRAEPVDAGAPASPAQRIRQLVNQAEDATTGMCMACGAPARVKSYGGNYLNLCGRHAPDLSLAHDDPRLRPMWEAVWAATALPGDKPEEGLP